MSVVSRMNRILSMGLSVAVVAASLLPAIAEARGRFGGARMPRVNVGSHFNSPRHFGGPGFQGGGRQFHPGPRPHPAAGNRPRPVPRPYPPRPRPVRPLPPVPYRPLPPRCRTIPATTTAPPSRGRPEPSPWERWWPRSRAPATPSWSMASPIGVARTAGINHNIRDTTSSTSWSRRRDDVGRAGGVGPWPAGSALACTVEARLPSSKLPWRGARSDGTRGLASGEAAPDGVEPHGQ